MRGSRLYSGYVLGLFSLIYAINFMDRQLITILAPYLKVDLNLTDAQIGLLFGTTFALFYALFGLPLARLADGWNRVRLLSLGLAGWSLMTMLSGLVSSFGPLAGARVGVAIGEASASPAAMSVLQDYFPKRWRATALSIYSSGIYIGAGISMVVGVQLVEWWQQQFGASAPLGLAGWQAAFILVGLPGVALALLTWLTVKEPQRGAVEGRAVVVDPHPFRSMLRVFAALIPLLGALTLRRLGAPWGTVTRNLGLALLCVLGAAIIVHVTDGLLAPSKRAVITTLGSWQITTNMVQWAAIAVGVYGSVTWVRALDWIDPAASRMIVGNAGFVAMAVAAGLISFVSYGISSFLFVYVHRYFEGAENIGVSLGLNALLAGGLGTTLGGVLSDAARRLHPSGRLWLAAFTMILSGSSFFMQMVTEDWNLFLLTNFLGVLFLTMWTGPVFASCQDLVPPHMRGTATAVLFLAANMIGLGMGPYLVGLASDATGNLRGALLAALALVPVASALLLFAGGRQKAGEALAIERTGGGTAIASAR